MLIEYWYVYIDVFWVNLAFIQDYILDRNTHLPTQTNGVSDPFKL